MYITLKKGLLTGGKEFGHKRNFLRMSIKYINGQEYCPVTTLVAVSKRRIILPETLEFVLKILHMHFKYKISTCVYR
jgi:hypothetical protein